MSSVDDKLRIPIEIKTEDSKEIQQLIQDIAEAENELRSLKPMKGKGIGDYSSRSAYTAPFSEGSGIYATQREGETLPTKTRDRTSKAAFSREREWDKMQGRIEELETRQDAIGEGLGILTQASGFGQFLQDPRLAGEGMFKKGLQKLGDISSKIFLPLAIITAIKGVVESTIDILLSPGGMWDRRYKRIISDEIAQTTERKDKEELRQGIRMIHITPYATYRGIGTARATENISIRYGIDTSLEYGAKGL